MRRTSGFIAVVGLMIGLMGLQAQAQERKSQRALATEPSPFTLDREHWQVEAGLVTVAREYHDAQRTGDQATSVDIGTTLFRHALTGSTEIQVAAELHRHQRVKPAHSVEALTTSGFGDITLALKRSLWGNDGGTTALALLPYVVVPTNRHELTSDRMEGGLRVPLTCVLADGYDVTTVAAWGYVRNGDDRGYHSVLGTVVTFNHPLVGSIAGFEEFASQMSSESGASWGAAINGGLSCALGEQMQADLACSVGLTRTADDVALSTMITRRF